MPFESPARGFKEPTREENGYTGDLVCTDCNAIVEAGEIIDKLPVTPPDGKPEPEIPLYLLVISHRSCWKVTKQK